MAYLVLLLTLGLSAFLVQRAFQDSELPLPEPVGDEPADEQPE